MMSTTIAARAAHLLACPMVVRNSDYFELIDYDRELCLEFIRECVPDWADTPENIVWDFMDDEDWEVSTQHDDASLAGEGYVLHITMPVAQMRDSEIEEIVIGKSWLVVDRRATLLATHTDGVTTMLEIESTDTHGDQCPGTSQAEYLTLNTDSATL